MVVTVVGALYDWGGGVGLGIIPSGNSPQIFLSDLISEFKVLILKEVE